MKAKILLSVLIINIICIGIYLAIKPATVEAENTKAPAKVQQKQTPQQQPQTVAADPGDQIEMIRQREAQVKSREMELSELEKQVMEKIRKLEAIESSLKVELEAYKVVAGERVKQLVKIYSSMKPKAAATLMNNLDQEVAVQVILGMKGDIAGGILSYMEPQKAAAISQKLMYFRTGIGAPSLMPAAPAPVSGIAPEGQKESAAPAPEKQTPAAPAISYQDEKPPVTEKAHTSAKRHILAKRAVQPKQAIALVQSSPVSKTVPAPLPVVAATAAPSSTPALATAKPAPATAVSTPVPASTPAPAAIEFVPAVANVEAAPATEGK